MQSYFSDYPIQIKPAHKDIYTFNNGKSHIYIPPDSSITFEQALKCYEERHNRINFSRHAQERIAGRELSVDESQVKRLESGVEEAEAKGINESLVMVDNLAFVVNVKNRMVITAMDKNSDIKKNTPRAFTKIDGAVIA